MHVGLHHDAVLVLEVRQVVANDALERFSDSSDPVRDPGAAPAAPHGPALPQHRLPEHVPTYIQALRLTFDKYASGRQFSQPMKPASSCVYLQVNGYKTFCIL